MNVFYLDSNPLKCAQEHCDKHVVKMIIEYAQLMSTAHRVLDGKEYYDKTANGRRIKRWEHPSPHFENKFYKASHVNHPSSIWVRESKANYDWMYDMWYQLCLEYTHRYGKVHATFTKLATALQFAPINIRDTVFSEPPPAMPDDCKITGDSVASYKKYYIQEKTYFAKWTKRAIPQWFNMKVQYA
jgi:hypothetical protein